MTILRWEIPPPNISASHSLTPDLVQVAEGLLYFLQLQNAYCLRQLHGGEAGTAATQQPVQTAADVTAAILHGDSVDKQQSG